MTIDQLRALDAIITSGSFRAAARKLNKVQSAVSYSIKTLEEELGMAVFSREGYRPVLTEAGQTLLRKARILLADFAEIEQLASQMTGGQEPSLRIDIAPITPLADLMPVFGEMADHYGSTQFQITAQAFGAERAVIKGETDLAITHVTEIHESLELAQWRTVTMIPVAAATHPLSKLGQPTRSDVMKHFQIAVGSDTGGDPLRTRGVFKGCSVWSVSNFATKKDLILNGMGWGNMPIHLIESEQESGQLRTLVIPGHGVIQVGLSMVRLREKGHGPVARKLWQLLNDCRSEVGD